MGGLVAIKASSLCRDRVQAVITDSAPSDFFEMMSRVLSWKVKRLSRFLVFSAAVWMRMILGIDIKDASALADIHGLKIPVLIIHGKNDGLVPVEMAETLYKHADEPKELLVVDNADHVQSIECDPDLYIMSIHDFLNRHITF